MGQSLKSYLESHDLKVFLFESAELFLESSVETGPACLLSDINLEGMNGLELLAISRKKHNHLPTILITGFGDIPMAVEALKNGAFNFLEKPLNLSVLLICINQAIKKSRSDIENTLAYIEAKQLFDTLTNREKEIFDIMIDGLTNKIMAHKLGITVSTVEAHRAKVMSKLKCGSLADVLNIGKILKHPENQRST